MVNIKPLWILDFYVHENWQREGHGKDLFDWVLEDNKIEPKMLAYDRPSHKFLSFLKKYFGLTNYFSQSNNFVVFDEYFEKLNEENAKKYASQTNYGYNNKVNIYGGSITNRDKNRRSQGVFTALGTQMMHRSESLNNISQSIPNNSIQCN